MDDGRNPGGGSPRSRRPEHGPGQAERGGAALGGQTRRHATAPKRPAEKPKEAPRFRRAPRASASRPRAATTSCSCGATPSSTAASSRATRASAATTFLLRRARPILQGSAGKYFEFNFTPDFGGGVRSSRTPTSTSRPPRGCACASASSSRRSAWSTFSPTTHPLRRTVLPSILLVPNRDVGFQLSGDLAGRRLRLRGGLFNGSPDGGQPRRRHERQQGLRSAGSSFRPSRRQVGPEGPGLRHRRAPPGKQIGTASPPTGRPGRSASSPSSPGSSPTAPAIALSPAALLLHRPLRAPRRVRAVGSWCEEGRRAQRGSSRGAPGRPRRAWPSPATRHPSRACGQEALRSGQGPMGRLGAGGAGQRPEVEHGERRGRPHRPANAPRARPSPGRWASTGR